MLRTRNLWKFGHNPISIHKWIILNFFIETQTTFLWRWIIFRLELQACRETLFALVFKTVFGSYVLLRQNQQLHKSIIYHQQRTILKLFQPAFGLQKKNQNCFSLSVKTWFAHSIFQNNFCCLEYISIMFSLFTAPFRNILWKRMKFKKVVCLIVVKKLLKKLLKKVYALF